MDVIKPYGENIYCYDIVSLYPYVMKNFAMPTGNIVKFEGDISKIDENAYGFFKVDVQSPDNLKIPILIV